MLMVPAPRSRPAVRLLPFIAAWALAAGVLLAFSAPAFRTRILPDPDDAMRLLEVRDWLAGQSWFDVTQYRMNGPAGGPMHWSRLVDLPIAAVILILRPLLGAAAAETAALVAVPLATLSVVMALVAALARRLMDRERAILACLLSAVSVMAVSQLRPFRIDHHGWQLALGLAAARALMIRDPLRSGLAAGAATALWLEISLEGLPMAAAIAALLAWRYVADRGEGARLAAFAGALALGAAMLGLVTHGPALWAERACDAVTLPYVAGLAAAAAATLILVRASPAAMATRGAGMLVAGGLGAAATVGIAPACARGPFQALDPLVHDFWYAHVAEGLPVFSQQPALVGWMLALPAIGLIGCLAARRAAARSAAQADWTTMIALLAAATLVACAVQRGAGLANLLALPGAVFVCHRLLVASRARPPLGRAAMLAAALALMVPGLVIARIVGLAGSDEAAASPPAAAAVRQCVDARELALLGRLAPATIAAPLDIGPAILVSTRHRIIASGHHRNAAAMRDVIRIFTLPPAAARALLARRGADWLVVCPDLVEPALYAERGPDGLWAALAAGRTPAWLRPVAWPGRSNLKVWRIR